MRKSLVIAAAVALLLAAQVERAEAQVRFGPQVALFDFDDLGVGVRVDVGLSDAFGIEDGFFQGLFASGNVNYLFTDGVDTALLINANANVPFSVEAAVTPYAGAGFNHWRYTWDNPFGPGSTTFSASGLNILGGLFFDLGGIPAFGELQYSTTGAGFLTLSGGILFGG